MTDNIKPPAKRKRGRPSTYDPEIAREILARLADGEPLKAICCDPRMPPAPTVREWNYNDRHGFSAPYARARDDGVDSLAEQCLEIADKATPENWNVARLRVDTRKWYVSKVAPNRYGDRIQVAGDADNPLTLQHKLDPKDRKDMARRIAFILQETTVDGGELESESVQQAIDFVETDSPAGVAD